jgi:hypothetical protein
VQATRLAVANMDTMPTVGSTDEHAQRRTSTDVASASSTAMAARPGTSGRE